MNQHDNKVVLASDQQRPSESKQQGDPHDELIFDGQGEQEHSPSEFNNEGAGSSVAESGDGTPGAAGSIPAPRPSEKVPPFEPGDKTRAWVAGIIDEHPLIASLLYDIDLLPEQIKDERRYNYMLAVIGHMLQAAQSAIEAIPVSEIEAEIAHIEENGHQVKMLPGMFDEGRCRELCAMYLREFIINLRAKKRLAALDGTARGKGEGRATTAWLIERGSPAELYEEDGLIFPNGTAKTIGGE